MKKKHSIEQSPWRMRGSAGLFKAMIALGCGLLSILTGGCSDSKQETSREYLIQVNDRTVSPDEFRLQLEKMNFDFAENPQQEATGQPEIRQYLLNQLIEKLILLERAEELNLRVADEEVEQAVKAIQKDYPEDTFKEVLLEQAVSFRKWKEELRTRLLLEKVIERELAPSLTLTPDEISAYYEKHFAADGSGGDDTTTAESLDETVFQMALNQKKEDAYRSWIAELQKRYRIDVNVEVWKKMNAAAL